MTDETLKKAKALKNTIEGIERVITAVELDIKVLKFQKPRDGMISFRKSFQYVEGWWGPKTVEVEVEVPINIAIENKEWQLKALNLTLEVAKEEYNNF